LLVCALLFSITQSSHQKDENAAIEGVTASENIRHWNDKYRRFANHQTLFAQRKFMHRCE